MKTYIAVDIEANGPIPGDYSMTSLGACIVDGNFNKSFKVNIKPISEKFDPNRRQFVDQENAVDAKEAMALFKTWLQENTQGDDIKFVSDNNGFDWMFVCWYFWHFLDECPFGFNSFNMQSMYKGLKGNIKAKIEELRERELLHDAEQDAIDNAKLFWNVLQQMK